MMYTIYRINFPDGKTYVGCTGDYKKRIYSHYACPVNEYAEKQVEKYGKKAIQAEILAEGVPRHLKRIIERHFIIIEGEKATNKMLPSNKKEMPYQRICRLLGHPPFRLYKYPIMFDAILNNKRTGNTIRSLMKLNLSH